MTTGYGAFNHCSPCCDSYPYWWTVQATINAIMWPPLCGPAPYTPYLVKTLAISYTDTVGGTPHSYSYTGRITLDPLREGVTISESNVWNAGLDAVLQDFLGSVAAAISTFNGTGSPPTFSGGSWTMSSTSITKNYSGYFISASQTWTGSITLSLSSAYLTGPADVATLLASQSSYSTMDAYMLTYWASNPQLTGMTVAYNKTPADANVGTAIPVGYYGYSPGATYPNLAAFMAPLWPQARLVSSYLFNPTGTIPALASTYAIDTGSVEFAPYQPQSTSAESYLVPYSGTYQFILGGIYIRIPVTMCLVTASVPITIATDGTETIGGTTTTYATVAYSAGTFVSAPTVPAENTLSWINTAIYLKADATQWAIWLYNNAIYGFAPVYMTCP